jgi:Right handed beta helix region
VGIAPNTEDSEPLAPQNGVTIIHNLVENNNNATAPVETEQLATIGTGILIAGVSNDVIEDNRVSGDDYYGILVVANIDQHVWEPHDNMVKGNVVTDSGAADLALAALAADNNCFSDNTVSRTAPPFLQYTHPCGSLLDRAGGDPSAAFYLLDHYMRAQLGHFQPRSWQTFPNPTLQQPGMPDPNIASQGIFAQGGGYALDMTVSSTTVHPSLTLGGLGLATPVGEIILGFYPSL